MADLQTLPSNRGSTVSHCVVNGLPEELLVDIFGWLHALYRADISTRGHPYLLDEIRVCRLWKTIIEGEAPLWQVVVPSPQNEMIRHRAMAFARDHPITCIASSRGSDIFQSSTLLVDILDVTQDLLRRIASIVVEHHMLSVTFEETDHDLPTIYDLAAQLLTGPEEAIAIHSIRISIMVDFKGAAGRPTPNLHHLHLEGVRQPPNLGRWAATLQSLVLVRVSDFDVSSLVDTLEAATQLSKLEIILIGLNIDRHIRRQPRSVVMPALTYINLCLEVPDAIAFLHYIFRPH
ncbi:unnamed protein product [Peniophora sp. CBMAI 1063]|nr:unnamed protein product [Peniophora sp. CBMAI 1063]